MAKHWEHASMTVTDTVEMVSADGARTLDDRGGNLRRAMIALDSLSAEGWEVVSYTLGRASDGALFGTYLLRRPSTGEPPQVY